MHTLVIHKAGHLPEVWLVFLLASQELAFEGSLLHEQKVIAVRPTRILGAMCSGPGASSILSSLPLFTSSSGALGAEPNC